MLGLGAGVITGNGPAEYGPSAHVHIANPMPDSTERCGKAAQQTDMVQVIIREQVHEHARLSHSRSGQCTVVQGCFEPLPKRRV